MAEIVAMRGAKRVGRSYMIKANRAAPMRCLGKLGVPRKLHSFCVVRSQYGHRDKKGSDAPVCVTSLENLHTQGTFALPV